MFRKILLTILLSILITLIYVHFNFLYKIDRDNNTNILLNSIIIEQNNQIIKNTKGKWI